MSIKFSLPEQNVKGERQMNSDFDARVLKMIWREIFMHSITKCFRVGIFVFWSSEPEANCLSHFECAFLNQLSDVSISTLEEVQKTHKFSQYLIEY